MFMKIRHKHTHRDKEIEIEIETGRGGGGGGENLQRRGVVEERQGVWRWREGETFFWLFVC
jgi:hypothetical protein